VKSATIEQVEKKQEKAVNFLRDVVRDSEKADEIAALSPEEYAERKKITINPGNGKRPHGKRGNPEQDFHHGQKVVVVADHFEPRTNPEQKFHHGQKVVIVADHFEPYSGAEGLVSRSFVEPDAQGNPHRYYHVNIRGNRTLKVHQNAIRDAAGQRRAKAGKGGRRNPDETPQAERMYETFHGKGPSEIIRVQEEDIGRDTYTALGDLLEMKLNAGGEHFALDFKGCGVKLCSSADGRQLYIVGGDQNCDACLPKSAPDKDIVILGILKKITYGTRKSFDKFQNSAYEHKFGEEGGEPPIAFYARTRKRIFIADGTYRIEKPGIID